jgi:hypothetical protein
MWDTTNPNLFPDLRKRHVERCGFPHLAKNERDMGHPTLRGREKDRMARLADPSDDAKNQCLRKIRLPAKQLCAHRK